MLDENDPGSNFTAYGTFSSCSCLFKSNSIFYGAPYASRHDIPPCAQDGGMGGRGRVSWMGGLMSTYGAAESIDGSALGLSPLTYKEALFRRCFNPK